MQYNFSINNRLSRSTSIHRRVHRSDDRGSNGIVCRPSDGRELMIGHRASHRAERVSVGVRNPVAAVHRREQSGGRGMAEERKKKTRGREREGKRASEAHTEVIHANYPAAINERLRSPHVESHCVLERSSQAAAPVP